MRCKAIAPVEIYDQPGRGIYAEGQIVEGDRAAFLLDKYPQFFAAVDNKEDLNA